jgi:hypothetical protein
MINSKYTWIAKPSQVLSVPDRLEDEEWDLVMLIAPQATEDLRKEQFWGWWLILEWKDDIAHRIGLAGSHGSHGSWLDDATDEIRKVRLG